MCKLLKLQHYLFKVGDGKSKEKIPAFLRAASALKSE